MARLSKHITLPKLNFYLAILLAFVMPINRLATSYIIVLWTVTWIIERIKKIPTKKLDNQQKTVLFVVVFFYLIQIVGLAFTGNLQNGLIELRIKLPFLIFPIFFLFVNKLYAKFFHLILSTFLFGIISMSFFLLIRATYFFPVEHIYSFFYSRFSYNFHPSYFSMYVTFALIIVFYLYERFGHNRKHLFFVILISLFFFLINFLLESKTGIFTFFLIISIYGIVKLYKKYKLLLVATLGIIAILLYAEIRHNPRMFELFHTKIENINKSTIASNEVRILVLKSALKVIQQNPFGYGTGDAKDVLVSEYKRERITGALKEKLNAHNQYLETTIGLGIQGTILLLFILIFPFAIAIKRRNYLLYLFIILVSMNFLTESMLNRENGVVFFTFFLTLLITIQNSKAVKIKQTISKTD